MVSVPFGESDYLNPASYEPVFVRFRITFYGVKENFH